MLNQMFKIDIHNDNKKKSTFNENTITTRDFVSTKYDPYDLDKRVKPKIELLESAKKSVNISNINFSNMLPALEESPIDSYIEIAIDKLKENPNILLDSCHPIIYNGDHKERIKDILLEYIPEEDFDEHSDYFRKSDVRTSALLETRGAFRVVGIYLIEPKKHKKQKHSKHYLKIVLIDPYHLFIPSRHNGLTAEEYKTSTYSTVSAYSRHIGELL